MKCHEDFLAVITAIHDALADEVIVVNSQQSRTEVAGELLAMKALRQELSGLVIDGLSRDTSTLASMRFPIYTRGASPAAGTVVRLGEIQTPILCGGVLVEPGEIVFGVHDGIVIYAQEELSRLIPAAEKIQRTEVSVLARLASGESLFSLINYQDHLDQLRAGKESKLCFTPGRGDYAH